MSHCTAVNYARLQQSLPVTSKPLLQISITLTTIKTEAMNMRTTSAIFVLATLLFFPPPSHSCSCGDGDIKELYNDAKLVFIGTLVEAKIPVPPDMDFTKIYPIFERGSIEGKFWVQKIYKGNPGEIISIYTPGGDSSCGIRLTLGEVYIIFTDKPGGDARMCGGSRRIERLSNEESIKLKELASEDKKRP